MQGIGDNCCEGKFSSTPRAISGSSDWKAGECSNLFKAHRRRGVGDVAYGTDRWRWGEVETAGHTGGEREALFQEGV